MAIDLTKKQLWANEYEIKAPLAKGGMATVYTAYAHSLDATVAIKVISNALAADPSFKQRFRAEATTIANLHHPNIIEVHHFGDEEGLAYIAMRYAPGGTLKEKLTAMGGPMDLRAATRLTAQVASALQYAHERGLIHLDVKPANVLLGNADWPLLSDFGIIRIAGEIRPEGNRIAGTPAYMSPEQWLGNDLDGRSDQYSLALMFFELVTGRRPFSGETSAELREKHIAEPPPRPRELNPGIPGPVEDVMLRALSKHPEDRYATIGEFGDALAEAVERSSGMQLETKQGIVAATPNIVALLVLTLVAPLLAGLAHDNLPVYESLTLDWPIRLLTAFLQSGLLLGIRWNLIGLLSRFLGVTLDSLNSFTRAHVRSGGNGSPLRIDAWRNFAVGAAEGVVNIAYLFVISQLLGPPFIQIVASTFRGLEDYAATGVAVVVLLVAVAIVLRLLRTAGPIVAVFALAVCWGLISAMPIVDQEVLGGVVSVQWLVKLAVGFAVLVALVAVRGRIARAARETIVPAIEQQIYSLRSGASVESRAATRAGLERGANELVDVLCLVVGYPIVALPLRMVLVAFVGDLTTAVALTVIVLIIALLLVNRLRVSSGVVAASLGLLVCTPTLLGLPLFVGDSYFGGESLQWVARLLIGLGVLAIFLGIRRQIQVGVRRVVVPFADQQLGGLIAAGSESQAAVRQKALEHFSDTLVNAVYLVAGYFAAVAPVTATLEGDLSWVKTAIYAVFILAVGLVVFGLVRGIVPALRAAPKPSPATA